MVEELLDRGAAKVYATARSPHTEPEDETTRTVESQLSHDLTNLYGQLAAA
jgi:hypothetical protein